MPNSEAIPAAVKLLRSWGVDVHIADPAPSNGRPYPFRPVGVVAHHTASATTASTLASRNVVLRGRTGIPGPLAQVFVARDGTVEILSYGRANHAGLGGPWRNVPKDSGNQYLIGVEVDNNGTTEKYSSHLLRTTHLVYAALLIALKRDASWLLGHKEWAPGRKVDPKLDMNELRMDVAKVIAERTAPPPKPPAVGGATYTVRKGDTLWDIARAHGTSVSTLTALNRLKDADEIRPGQTLRLPAPKTYTVRPGDTLWAIARRFNSTVTDLARVNQIPDASALPVGKVLTIPGN